MPARTHGQSATDVYAIYRGIRTRIFNENHRSFIYYGARGITLCERWDQGEDGLTGFEAFAKDMGPRPSKKHTVERVNNDGHYEPSNCRWDTRSAQVANRRGVKRLTLNGETMSVADWAARLGVRRERIDQRLARGWDAARALTQPSRLAGSSCK